MVVDPTAGPVADARVAAAPEMSVGDRVGRTTVVPRADARAMVDPGQGVPAEVAPAEVAPVGVALAMAGRARATSSRPSGARVSISR